MATQVALPASSVAAMRFAAVFGGTPGERPGDLPPGGASYLTDALYLVFGSAYVTAGA